MARNPVHSVTQQGTMVHMVQRPSGRVHIGVRLSTAGLAAVEKLAADETEGNTSAMIRKLLREALDARARRGHA